MGSAVFTTAALPSQEVHLSVVSAQAEPAKEPECGFNYSRSPWTCEEVVSIPHPPGDESVLTPRPPTPHLHPLPTTRQDRGTCSGVTDTLRGPAAFLGAISRPGSTLCWLPTPGREF